MNGLGGWQPVETGIEAVVSRLSASSPESDTTVSGNSSGAKGGGIYNGQNALLMLWSSTITANTTLTGGGIFNDDSIAPIPLFFDASTVVTGNTPNDCVNC